VVVLAGDVADREPGSNLTGLMDHRLAVDPDHGTAIMTGTIVRPVAAATARRPCRSGSGVAAPEGRPLLRSGHWVKGVAASRITRMASQAGADTLRPCWVTTQRPLSWSL